MLMISGEKNAFSKAGLSRQHSIRVKLSAVNRGWKGVTQNGSDGFVVEGVVLIPSVFRTPCDVAWLILLFIHLKGNKARCLRSGPCAAVLRCCQQVETAFLFSGSHALSRKGLVSAWRSCRFSAFLFTYLTVTAPAPGEPGSYFWSCSLASREQIQVL